MALNAGEVEVLLKLKDELSQQLKTVKEQLKGTSADAGTAGVAMKNMSEVGAGGMQNIAKETKEADKAHSTMMGTVKQLALAFGAMFTAQAALGFVKSVVAEASALKDLSQQTHINVEDLQMLAGAMSEFGVDADALGKGLYGLSRRISQGDDSVSDALKQMGMELKDVKGLNGEELFLAIMRGLSKLDGGLRDETASDLFGSRLGMAMAGASEDIEGTLETWKRFNTVMSTETVNALDETDESIKRMNKSLSMVAANMLGPVSEGFNVLFDAHQKGMSNWQYAIANAKDFAASLLGTGTGTENLTRLLDGLNVKTDAGKTATKGAATAHREFLPALEDTTGATKRARDAAAEHTKEIEKNEVAYQKLMSDVKNANQLAIMEADAAKMATDALDKKRNAAAGWIAQQVASTKEVNDAIAADKAYMAEQTALTAANDALNGSFVTLAAAVDTTFGGALDKVGAKIKATTLSWSEAMSAVGKGLGTMTGTVQAPMTDAQWKKAAADAGGQVNKDSYGNKYIHVPGQNAPGEKVPGYAAGGPTKEGPAYLHNDEYVVPKAGALVLGGGGGNKTMVVQLVMSDGRELARAVVPWFPGELRRIGVA